MAYYEEPTGSDTESIYTIFDYVNRTAGGYFFPVMLLVIWIVAFISMLASGNISRPSASKAWVFASFLTSILSIPLAILDLVGARYMYLSFLMLGIGAIWAILEGGNE